MYKWIISAGLLIFSSCTSLPFAAKEPKDFATIDPKGVSGDPQQYRAINEKGLMYRVSATPNTPRAGLAFWAEAMQKDLEGKGYILVQKDRKKIGTFERESQEWSIPTSGPAQIYWVWMRAGSKHILIAEGGGSSLIFPQVIPDLIEAADSIHFDEKDYQP